MRARKHTPGPWLINGDRIVASNPRGNNRFITVCRIASANDPDARLISAAPKLLAALKTLMDENGLWVEDHPDVIAARAAIADAEGA